MPESPIDYPAIFKEGNRSWSLRLVDRLGTSVDKPELKEILRWMEEFDDFRLEAPLTRMLEDRNLSELVRDHVSLALCELTTFETPSQRQIWWSSGDVVLMRHAIRNFERWVPEEAALIEALANDTSHKLHADAIEALSFYFPEQRFQDLKIKALSHSDPRVRKTAAKALYWDQPLCAEAALLKAATDPEDQVAIAALDSLCWYRSQNALLQVHNLRCQGREKLFHCYNNTFHWILEDCLEVIDGFGRDMPAAVAHYRKWLEPLWDILGYCDQPTEALETDNSNANPVESEAAPVDEQSDTKAKATQEEAVKPSVAEIIAILGDPDTPHRTWEDRPYNWRAYSETERNELRDFFFGSPDHLVRKVSARAFVEWNDATGLVSLINDRAHNVRRAACYRAKDHTPNATIKDALFQTLCKIGTTSSFAVETLASYIVHAEEDGLDETLLNFVLNDDRQEVREAAAWALDKRKSEKISSALPLLYHPPMLTWALHSTLLYICNSLELPVPDMGPLMKIDDIPVQEQLAKMIAACHIE